jgi:hypothetical protein
MSVEEFVAEILEENKEDLDELAELQKVLDQLQKDRNEIYFVSVTSNL